MSALLILNRKEVTDDHLRSLICDLRQSDFVEMVNCGLNSDLLEALATARDEGEDCWLALERSTGKPVAFWGIGRHNDDLGVVWLLATELLKEYPRSVLSMGRAFIYGCLTQFETLANHVDLTHKEAVRLIQKLGGELVEKPFNGNLGTPIQKFEFKRGKACVTR